MISIRPVQAHEWRTYQALRLSALRDSPDAFGSTYAVESAHSEHFWQERIQTACASEADHVLLADKEGQACGLVWCKLSASEPAVADIYQMWVAPSARGLQAGYGLLDASVKWANSKQAACIRLSVTLANAAAVQLYKKYGFSPSGEPEPLCEGSSLMSQTLVLDLAG
ncbi:GNAT family N-acetyltransferase [Alcaligenes aquatilis]|uniref:GNAT family N-acetyltransferase n=1 Tax=Alcaligenes aquatilis TaxID=323284 RepID=UPI003D1B395C